MIHWRSSFEKPRSFCALGRAMFTIVRSSTIISCAVAISARINQRRSWEEEGGDIAGEASPASGEAASPGSGDDASPARRRRSRSLSSRPWKRHWWRMQTEQRSAVVFGARTLGRAIIELLVSDGWAVTGVARSQSTLDGISASGALALEADVTDPASVYGALERAATAHGRGG